MTDRLDLAVTELVDALREAVRAEAADGQRAPDRLYSIPETCEALGGIGRSMVYDLIARGELSSLRVGRRRFIAGATIHNYIRLAAGSPAAGISVARPESMSAGRQIPPARAGSL